MYGENAQLENACHSIPSQETGSSRGHGQTSATSTEAPNVVFKTGSIHNTCDSPTLAGSSQWQGQYFYFSGQIF